MQHFICKISSKPQNWLEDESVKYVFSKIKFKIKFCLKIDFQGQSDLEFLEKLKFFYM